MTDTSTLERPVRKAREKARHVIEQGKHQAGRLSSGLDQHSSPIFAGLALGSIIFALTLFFRRSKENALFVGLWAPTFLALGSFHKLMGIKRREGPLQ